MRVDKKDYPQIAQHLLVPLRQDGGFEAADAAVGDELDAVDYKSGEVVAVYALRHIVKIEKGDEDGRKQS